MKFKKGDKISLKNFKSSISFTYNFEDIITATGLITAINLKENSYKIIINDEAFLGGDYTFYEDEIKDCEII
ncbi:MAG: hypothetical protein ACFE96_12995 [Candidatus Hermodarchaeota archaeon]